MKRGGRGRPWWSLFCPVTSRGAPWEPWERWAVSRPLLWFHALMLFALSGANCFSVTLNTRPVLFIMTILSYNSEPGTHYSYTVALFSVWNPTPLCFSLCFHCCSDLTMIYRHTAPLWCLLSQPFLHFSLSQHVSSLIFFPISWLASHFPSAFLLFFSPLHSCSFLFSSMLSSHLFALVSCLLYCHQLFYTEQHVITFVLHRLSLIGIMP